MTIISTTDNMDFDDWLADIDEDAVEIVRTIDDNTSINSHVETNEDNEDPSTSNREEMEGEDDTPVSICVDETITKDPKSMSACTILQCECSIAYFVQILIEESFNEMKNSGNTETTPTLSRDKIKNISEYLRWIYRASQDLADRIGQEMIPYSSNGHPTIVRSSYNFCTKYTQCKNFYSKHEAPTCREHHYVHSLLCFDISSVIEFLDDVMENNLDINQTEMNNLYLSIKTICFVTRHMAREISYINYITKNNAELFHRTNPIDSNRRKLFPKSKINSDNHMGLHGSTYSGFQSNINSNKSHTGGNRNSKNRYNKFNRNGRNRGNGYDRNSDNAGFASSNRFSILSLSEN